MAANNELIRDLADLLVQHAFKVRVLNGCNLMDEAVGTEAWAREAAEILLRRQFFCSNILSAQQDTFDIHGGKTIIQVTSNLRVDKVQHTLTTYEKNGHHNSYPRLFIFLIGEKPAYKRGDFSKLKLKFRFSPARQIVGIKELVRAATRLRLNELQRLLDVTRAYFGKKKPDVIGIDHLHQQCKDFQRDLESCRTIVEKAVKTINGFSIQQSSSTAGLSEFLASVKRFESVIKSWSDMARNAAMTSSQIGPAKVEDVSNIIAAQHLALIRAEAQFERMAQSIMDEAQIRQVLSGLKSGKASIESLEEELQCAVREEESAAFAAKFLYGI